MEIPLPQGEVKVREWDNGGATLFARGSAPIDTEVIPRAALGSSPRRGPLVIEEFDATTIVPPDAGVHRDAVGNIVLELA